MSMNDLEPGDTCRACLKQEGNMYSLYQEYEANVTLASLLKVLLRVDLCLEDGLPSTFCEECAHSVIDFYNFSVVFEESEATLQNALKELQTNELEAKRKLKNNGQTFEFTEKRHKRLRVDSNDDTRDSEENNQIPLATFTINEDNFLIKEDSRVGINGFTTTLEPETNSILEGEESSDSTNNISKVVKVTETSACSKTNETSEFTEAPKITTNPPLDKIANYEKIPRYECKDCGDVYLYPSAFQKHMNNKHNKTTLDPDLYCTVIYHLKNSNINNTNDYSNNLSEKTVASLRCRTCSKKFDSVQLLKDHMKSHTVEKPFICEVCGRAFAKKSYLVDHSACHSEAKEFECKFCKKQFKRRTVLIKHLKIHTCPKGIICEVCGQKFTDKSTLTTHQLIKHIKKRNFKCMICGMTFNLKATLDKHVFRHQRQHTDKTFSCSVCNMKYYDKSSLKRHFDTKHIEGDTRVGCELCGKLYSNKSSLTKHMDKVHRNECIAIDDVS